jgi:hypothetical protein
MEAIVRPRKTSSETSRVLATDPGAEGRGMREEYMSIIRAPCRVPPSTPCS